MIGEDLLLPKPTKRQRQAKILTIDLERLPGLAYAFQARTDYISADRWVQWPKTICFAAKWLGQDEVMFHSVWNDGHEAMTKASWDLYDAADQVITYNGVQFDNKIFRQDWITAGFKLPAPWKDVDLLKEVRRSLGFESNSLQSVLTRLGMDGKMGGYSIPQAQACVDGDVEAQSLMETYCKGDVIITERLYRRLLGWLPSAPIVGGVVREGDLRCPQCGSKKLTRKGWHRATVQEYARYQCERCGGWARSNLVRRVSNTRPVR